MLALLLVLGSGPASFLGERFEAASRLAMAPVLGLCAGTCVLTTLAWFFPARQTFWLVPVLALLSLTVALWRVLAGGGKGRTSLGHRAAVALRSLRTRDVLALALVCLVVAAPLDYTLHERHSVGPTGFEIWDTDGYVAETDGMQQQSIRQGEQTAPPDASLVRMVWLGYTSGTQQLDAVPLSANVNELLGLHATDTQTLFLIVFLIAGGLGAFAAVRYAAPRPRWVAPLAGVLFAGPFFLQLMSDGSQAATCGLALMLPTAAVGIDALRGPRLASLALFALLGAGLMALYPLFVPAVFGAAAILLLVTGFVRWQRGQLTPRGLARAAGLIGLTIALSILLDLVGFLRDVRYWHGVLNGVFYIEGLPVYHLPYSVLPGWLLQTREFYALTELGSTTPSQILIGVILPVVFIAVIVYGIKRNRIALMLALLVPIIFAIAEYTNAAHHCSYCTDRTLLPIAPLGIGLLALGIAALAVAPNRWLRWCAVAVAVIAIIAVGERTRQERVRFADGAYYLDSGDRSMLSHLPERAGPVELEGYGEDPAHSPGEFSLVYLLAWERNHMDVSVPTEYTDSNGLIYLGGPKPGNPQLKPSYRYVLTRFAAVQTGRRTIARTGPLALEERTGGLDANVVSGLAVPPVRLDAQGLAWVEAPLHLVVVGGGHGPAWVSLRFQTLVPVTVPPRKVSARA